MSKKGLFTLRKKFKCPIGHRLSNHEGLCKNTHGHEFYIIVSIKSKYLGPGDMVIDFSDLKKIVNKHIDKLDHGFMINKNDPYYNQLVNCSEKVTEFDGDPTAEKLSEYLYHQINKDLLSLDIDSVEVFENENSSVIYREIEED